MSNLWILMLAFNSGHHNLINYEVTIGTFTTYEACAEAINTIQVSQLSTNGWTNETRHQALTLDHAYCKPQS